MGVAMEVVARELPRSPQDPSSALKGCLEVCVRCTAVVETLAGRDGGSEQYRIIGPHLRHCLDHFLALLRGLDDGCIDYDFRERCPRLERHPERALEVLGEISARLAALVAEPGERAVEVAQLGSADGRPSTVRSSLERELLFLSSHTVHHLAIMIEIARAHSIELPAQLGVAFSTARHAERNGEAQR